MVYRDISHVEATKNLQNNPYPSDGAPVAVEPAPDSLRTPERMKVELFSDGSSRGNPGPGGYGTILRYTGKTGTLHEKELSEGFRNTTNNRMELMGVIAGLEALTKPCIVDVWSDSQYVIKAFNDHWIDGWKKKGWKKSDGKPVLNDELWKRLLRVAEPHQITWHWVKGHAGHPENERCDALATAAADASNLIED